MDSTQETTTTFPTHRLKDIKAGDSSVQLLVSTKDNLYDADNVESGAHAWQVLGAWEATSVSDLSNILSKHQPTATQDAAENHGFRSRHRGGQKLGTNGALTKDT